MLYGGIYVSLLQRRMNIASLLECHFEICVAHKIGIVGS